MDKLVLRHMVLEDIDRVLEIEKLSFKTPWTKEAFLAELEANSCAMYIVVEQQGEIVAYGGMWCILDEGHITNIATHPDSRKKGLGTILVEAMLEQGEKRGIRRFTLEVRVGNHSAISLYEKLGFETCGIRKGYYQDTGEDAYIMWKESIEK